MEKTGKYIEYQYSDSTTLRYTGKQTAYGGLQSLQSSLNADQGLGTASLSVLYGAIILSSMFLPPILIKNLGCKWTIVVSMGCYVAYSLGNLYPSWETLIPTSIILGLGGAPLWSAKCTYLTISGNMQGKKENKEGRDIINQYFGIFFLIFQSSAVWGNLMSSLIFELADDRASITEEQLNNCGAADCPITNVTGNSTIDIPPDSLRYTLVGSYIDDLDKEAAQEFRDNRQPFFSVFLATFKHLRDKRQILLIPMTMYSGFEQGFLAGDYNKSYVTCALGIRYVGYSMICFGATNSIFSIAFGKLSRYTGRIALFALASITEEQLNNCGAADCPVTNVTGNSTTDIPPDSLRYTLVGSYIDDLDKEAAQEFRDNRQPFFSVFLATFKHLRDKRQILLIPMTMYSGFEQGFLAGDYNKSYVTCALGIRYVGYSMICFGATNSIFSIAFGKLSRYTGRIALFALGTVTNLSCIIALFLWNPHPDNLAVFFVFSALWGMADAVWQTQTNLYGVLFEKHMEAAFANYKLWESVGFVIAFGYSSYLCVDVKLYVVLAVLVVGMVLYGCVEYIEYKNPTA
ncbi:UNVERIFIED_CONTAM: hypothetical protein FKN15_044132 [Acipenser sinensis]